MAFQNRLQREFQGALTLYSAAKKQRINIENIMRSSTDNTIFYVCGPATLIAAVINTAEQLDVKLERIRYERFGVGQAQDAKAITVELARSNKVIYVEKDQSLLDAIINERIETPFSCKTGDCKTCATKVLNGEPQHLDNCLTEEERQQQ